MNSAQRRVAFRSLVREFVPGLAVVTPTGKVAHVIQMWQDGCKPFVSVKRKDNHKVSIAPSQLTFA